jgi:hypothetical protein
MTREKRKRPWGRKRESTADMRALQGRGQCRKDTFVSVVFFLSYMMDPCLISVFVC